MTITQLRKIANALNHLEYSQIWNPEEQTSQSRPASKRNFAKDRLGYIARLPEKQARRVANLIAKEIA